MKLLPPPGPERNRAVLFALVALIGLVGYFTVGPGASDSSGDTQAIVPPAASAKPGLGVAPGRPGARGNMLPQPLKLAEMEQIPDEPNPTRNIFRFGVPPPPPPPPPTPAPVWTPPPAPTPTPPPPPPPVPLKLNTILVHAAKPGVFVAYLQLETPQGAPPGEIFEALQGDIVDGKYKVLIVTENSVVVAHLDGVTSRRTMQLPRGR